MTFVGPALTERLLVLVIALSGGLQYACVARKGKNEKRSDTVNEERVLIGSAHFIFEDEGVTVPLNEQERFDRLPEEYSHLYLAIGRELAAVICISDPLRREAKEVLTALRALGIQKTVMLTGDSYRTASTVANRLGVDAFCAEVLPADKARYVADLRREGHVVLMVGDGINDSPTGIVCIGCGNCHQ